MIGLLGKVKELIRRRRTVYIQTFICPPGEEVLQDLARFCRAFETTYHDDPRKHAVAEGRREVWLRIQQHLNLDEDELWARYAPSATRRDDD